MKKDKGKVFVGLSGGVDSSVAALRLIREGYDVTGVFIKVWQPEWLRCNGEEERLDAMRVAAHLEVPFITCDAEEAYRKEVGEYFIREYQAGRTPNPDVLCNQHVKFGAFLDFALESGADYVATGHYARREEVNGQFELHRGIDTNKDQSYFLWTLNQEQLRKILLPVGSSTKVTIRSEAAKANIPTATKKDSQGVCFLGHIDIPEFLSHYTDLKAGAVLDQSGKRIGEHKGALVYTLGQRHGFTIDGQGDVTVPHYVVTKDIETNTLTVSTTPPETVAGNRFRLDAANFIPELDAAGSLEAQFRYRQQPFGVAVSKTGDGAYLVTPKNVTDVPALGQSCVLYKGERCLGGGIIAEYVNHESRRDD